MKTKERLELRLCWQHGMKKAAPHARQLRGGSAEISTGLSSGMVVVTSSIGSRLSGMWPVSVEERVWLRAGWVVGCLLGRSAQKDADVA